MSISIYCDSDIWFMQIKEFNINMNNTYKFYQNKQCEYFPCHDVADSSSFNCLFCYCPLYLKEPCLGHPDYILNGKGQRIKDCSSCTVVHRPEMYEKVLEELGRQRWRLLS